MTSTSQADPVVIVGGGAIGLLCARELAMAGRRVTVIERGEIGRESSWAGGGILSPLYPWRYPAAVTRLAAWSQQAYPLLTAELTVSTGTDPEWIRSGLLVLDPEEAQPARLWGQGLGEMLAGIAAPNGADLAPPPVELVEASALRTIEPALGPQPERSVWLAHVAQVRNPRLVAALRVDCAQRGVSLRGGVEVTGFERDGRLFRGIQTSAGPIEAGCCVVAAGAWSGRLLAGVGVKVPIEPVRGQMIVLRAPPGTVHRILLRERRYVIPRRDGRVLAGSTLEYVGFEKRTTDAARDELRDAAVALVPSLADAPIEHHWAGLRPGSPDEVPYIGMHPEVEGLYVCAGHFRNGLVLGPASARLLADLVLEREPLVDPAPYGLERPGP